MKFFSRKFSRTCNIKCLVAGLSVCFIFSLPAFAENAEDEGKSGGAQLTPVNSLFIDSLTAGRYNPLGLMTRVRLMYSRKLIDSTKILLRDTFFALGPSLKVSPSNLYAGLAFELQPLALLHLSFGYDYAWYYKSFSNMQSFPVSGARYSDKDREKNGMSAYPAWGHHYFAEQSLQFKYGYFAVKTTFSLEYWAMNLHWRFSFLYPRFDTRRDKYFYEPTLDSLVPNRSLIWSNDTNLVYVNGRLTAGLRFSGVFPGFSNQQIRLGPLFLWSFHSRDYTAFNNPTLIVILQWYLVHPSRIGAVPYMILGLSFSSDLL